MRYYEIIQPKKSKPQAAPKTGSVNPMHPRVVRIASGAGPVRMRAKGRKAYIVNDGVTSWCPSSPPIR
jgi:hypothetical protein